MRLFCFLWMLLPLALLAQPSHWTDKGWQALTISDGLSQGMIFDLKQDQKGFIWVATKDGLNRYDGHNVKVFSYDPYNQFSISDNACSSLLIDRKGRLWVGTFNKGLNLYDDKTQRFYHIAISSQASANANNVEIQVLTEDPEGNIWVGTNVGKSFKIELPASLQQGFPEEANFTSQVRIQSFRLGIDRAKQDHLPFSFNANGQALTGSSHGLYSFNWRKPSSFAKRNLFSLEAIVLYDLYEDPQQDFLLVSTHNHIKAWHQGAVKAIDVPGTTTKGAQIERIDKNTLAIWTVSYLWLLSANELFSRDSLRVQDAFVTFPPDLYAVTSILRDKTGNIWAGTSGYGLRKFNPQVKQFHAYLPKISLSQLYVDKQGRSYVRHQYAYSLLNRETNRLVPFLDENLPEADRRQRFFIQDRQGFFWVSNTNFQTHEQFLLKFSSNWQLLKKYPMPVGTEFGFWGNQTLEDSSGYLWLGAMMGKLVRFDPKSESFTVFSYQASPETETYALVQESDSSFWIGTQQGLIKASHLATKPTFTYYKNSATNRQSLSNDFVLCLANDPNEPDRYLWIGTKGGGLDRLDKQTGHFEHFTEVQGLPNKVVYGILSDPFHHLWLSTNRGLSQFNPQTKQFRNYTRADGLQDDEFNTSSFFKAASGELLFGGVNGLSTFQPSKFSGMGKKPPLVNIIGVKVNNKPVEVRDAAQLLTQGIEYTRQLDLAHDQNLLTFEFSAMDYTNSANNRYRYRLAGIDREWVEAGTNRFANYAQLPDGSYTLQVMGSADGENWSKPVELQIRVHPPVYRTWWAYLFYTLVLLAVGWQLYRFQTQRLLLEQQVDFEQKEASRLVELDALKTQFFTNISHEFRTPLTLILGPLNDLRKRFRTEKQVTLTEPTVVLMEQNSNRLLSLINQLLDLSKLEAGQLKAEPQPGDIAGFFRTLASSFISLAESRGVTFHFSQNQDVVLASFDHDKCEKIVTNLLSNAFKFTPEGQQVRMQVHYPESDGATLQLTVADTGIGIAPKDLSHIFERFYQRSADVVNSQSKRYFEGTGIGLALVYELTQVLNGKIEVVSTEDIGTTFTVTLPLVNIDTFTAATSWSAKEMNVAVLSQPIVQSSTIELSENSADNILLIIDDNADIRAYVRSIFETDYQILEAVDGLDGLEKATATLPDLIICDLMMPRLDGFGFCRKLKTQEATSHIPVVMLTAKATVEDRIEGFELGADDYLTKPFNRDEIQARVRNLILQRQRLYKHFATQNPAPVTALSTPEPTTSELPLPEQKFLNQLRAVVMEHIDQADFTVEALAEAVNMNRVQLYRKLKAIINSTATDFIRDIRLEQAAVQLQSGTETVSQIAYSVGFDSLSYFSKVFQERYQVPPSKYGRMNPGQVADN
ncbi:response regulator [Spirosoma sp. BT702]|uniref:histidine kinase n=1 Tax=Spirosoma profusum TaxID=2771354 RepID=A0A927GAB1_9BACT|nr:two-component regulator propeller domain-containing protein [Spirosoma profusum]MBD2705099.1 response regulator [Spirosoma profusum]